MKTYYLILAGTLCQWLLTSSLNLAPGTNGYNESGEIQLPVTSEAMQLAKTNDQKRSPITNRWGEVKTKKLPAQHVTVYQATEGASYSHHPQITSINGKLIATWSNGIKHEDDPGQRMMIAVSEDKGDSWSEAKVLVESRSGKYADAIITAMGIRSHGQKLMAYYGIYEYTENGLVEGSDPPERPATGKALWPEGEYWSFGERTEIIVSKDFGDTWSEPVGSIEGFIPNMPPGELRSGRLIIPGNLMFPYTDDPQGITGWKRVGIPGLPDDYIDAPGRFQKEAKRRNSSWNFCEGSFYQTDDGVIHMMLRSDSKAGLLGVTESTDNGETWSEPVLTGFTDCRSRFHFDRLPDGRFIAVSCPEPGSRRNPMVLQISEDGVIFDEHYIIGDEPNRPPRFAGHHKGSARYGYPSFHIMDDWMYVIYSVAKEDISICRFNISSL